MGDVVFVGDLDRWGLAEGFSVTAMVSPGKELLLSRLSSLNRRANACPLMVGKT